MPPLISVLLPVYNGEAMLRAAADSVLAQTFADFELLILNDGSTDNTKAVAAKVAISDPRVRLYNFDHQGLTKTLNQGIALSRGRFIARQDADDTSVVERFQEQLPPLLSMNYGACCARAFDLDLRRPVPRLFWLMLPRGITLRFINFHIHGSLMIKKEILDSIGGYDETFRYAQDYKLFHDLYKNNIRVKYLKKILYSLGHDGNSVSKRHKSEQVQGAQRVRRLFRTKHAS